MYTAVSIQLTLVIIKFDKFIDRYVIFPFARIFENLQEKLKNCLKQVYTPIIIFLTFTSHNQIIMNFMKNF